MARQRLLGALICSSGAWLGPFSPGLQRPAAVSLLTALTANHKELCMHDCTVAELSDGELGNAAESEVVVSSSSCDAYALSCSPPTFFSNS